MNGHQILELQKYIVDNSYNKVYVICVTVIIVTILLSFVICYWRKLQNEHEKVFEMLKNDQEQNKMFIEFVQSREMKCIDYSLFEKKKEFEYNHQEKEITKKEESKKSSPEEDKKDISEDKVVETKPKQEN